MQTIEQQFIDTKGASHRVGLSTSTLKKMRLTGGGPRYNKLGRAVRYSLADLDAWLAETRRASTSAAA